jgi:superoxide dismutase, Cu-Zn family
MKAFVCAAAIFLATGCASVAQETHAHASAKPVVVEIKNAQGQNVGTATLSPAAQGVKIKLDIKDLPAGEHSMHIHQVAKCDAPDFKTAGPHFTPASSGGHDEHSHQAAPAGDIPNFSLIVGADGTARVTIIAPNVTMGADDHSVFSNGGTAIVIHAATSGTTGAAPARIACGIISNPE